MDRIGGQEIQNFATPSFRNIFGKGLSEFSDKDFKKVAKSLNKCSHQRWVTHALEEPFNKPAQMQAWILSFEKMEESVRKAKLEEEKKLYRERYQREVQRTGYNAAELLKETNSFRLHAAFLNNGYGEWCSSSDRQAYVALILNKSENEPVDGSGAYWASFENEMLPAIRSACPTAEKVYVFNYVSGFFINYDQYIIVERTIPSFQSDPINIGIFTPGAQSKYSWLNGGNFSEITNGRSQRTPRRVVIDDQVGGNASAAQNSTITELKQSFKKKRDEIAVKEQKRRDEQKKRDEEIAKQRKDAEEARQRRLALESKNGLEPNSEQLAIAFIRPALAASGCGNIVFNEVCVGNFGMTFKVYEAKKNGCKMITKGSNYHCVFTMKIEVRGHPLYAPTFENGINGVIYKIGYTKSSSGWTIYPLSEEQRNAI
ncbi:MAG: hypothetical protein WA584_14620 [Pyrinomonadaceae bacterium]